MNGIAVAQRDYKQSIFLIDGSSFLYRAYYGLRPLQTSSGIPVQATYGFCRAIKKIIDDFDPSYIGLIWDSKGPTIRQEVYTAYKATRQAPPSDLGVQRDYIKQFAQDIGLLQLEKPGYEADDIIASIVKELAADSIIIVTPDKDLRQLVCERVIVFDPFKHEFIDEHIFKEKYGFEPAHLLLYHALLGDSSDNIPGVKGIGKQGASELVKQYGTLRNVYAHLNDIESKRLKSALETHRDDAFLSERLFTLETYSLGLEKSDFRFDKKNLVKAVKLFEELEFKSLVKQVGGTSKEMESASIDHSWKLHLVVDLEALNELVNALEVVDEFAYDTETSGLDPLQDSLVGISIAFNNQEAFYIPVGHVHAGEGEQLDRDLVLKKLAPVFSNPYIKKILHHAKFDQLALLHYGIQTNAVSFDTLIAAHLLRSSGQTIGLKQLSVRLLNEQMQTYKEVAGKHKSFADVAIAHGARYGAHDALQTFKIKPILERDLDREPSLANLFYTIEMPISQILIGMELRGILLDQGKMRHLGEEIGQDLDRISGKIRAAIAVLCPMRKDFAETINLNSPRQLEELLFDMLELPVIKKSKEGSRSTDAEVLEELSSQHPVPAMLLEYRELYKLKSTYIDPLPRQINPETGKIHTTFNQTDVATGRLSSSNPNLQNIPVGSIYGKQIREAFVASKGYKFLSADYSQIELRVLAHLSQDPGLLEAFKQGKDIHMQTAAQIFGVSLGEVTQQQRQVGKRINFSIMYGLTAYGLSRDLNIKLGQAKEYIESYFAQYPRVHVWMESVVEQAKKDGYVQTSFGRRRHIPELHEKNRTLFEAARRIAINTPVQGTSADIMKIAMIRLKEAFLEKSLDAHMILQIHDELLIEFREEDQQAVAAVVKQAMEEVVSWSIPLEIALRVGHNWGEVTK